MKTKLFGRLAGLLLPLLLISCQHKTQPRNLVLLTLDTQRADFVSSYEPANASTPNIDLLAAEGVRFRNAYSLIPITLPSHASLFFSEVPSELRSYNNGQVVRARRSTPSLAYLFQKNGFTTAAFVSLGVLTSQFGLAQGFETYEDNFPPDRWYLSAAEVNERVFPWLEKAGDQPFFLWIHYSDPHEPYAPPDSRVDFKLYLNDRLVQETSLQKYTLNQARLDLKPGRNELRIEFENEFDSNPDHFLGQLDRLEFSSAAGQEELKTDFLRGWYIRRRSNTYFFKDKSLIEIMNNAGPRQVRLIYRGKPLLSPQAARICYRREVEYMDGEIGRLRDKLRDLGLLRDTAFVLVGDHGEGLGEFRSEAGGPHIGHIHYLYDIYMRVPLIIRNPLWSEKGISREDFVTLLDLAPTIARIMNLRPRPHFRGGDLFRRKKPAGGPIFEETYRPESYRDRFGLLAYPWHLIFTPKDKKLELFNLKDDPGETARLGLGPDISPEVLALKRKLEARARKVLSGKEEVKIDEKTREMLRALGYVR